MSRFTTRLGDRADLSVPRGVSPRIGARYDADFFGRMSEAIARFLGTGRYLGGQTVFVIGWIILNTIGIIKHWDPYPFILLNLAFSTQAAYAAPLILLAQNRQDDRDRANIERDREVAARTQADTEFLARELASVRLALADVVTTQDLEESLSRLAKLIADQLQSGADRAQPGADRAQSGVGRLQSGASGALAPPDGQLTLRRCRRGPGSRGRRAVGRVTARQAWTMDVPWTLMVTGASGEVAGPLTTEPLAMLNLLPWHGQLMVPPDTVPTMQP
jgi:uncharacterized membrane protein